MYTAQTLTNADFKRLSEFIQANYGIKMPPAKQVMLESRLRLRLRATRKNTFTEYTNYLFSEEGMKYELMHMIDAVSTNKTDFYRESAHFDYLTETILPKLYNREKARQVKIWCAATSTGEEPYTIAFTLEEFISKNPLMDYSIYCTDISTRVLEKALLGIYHPDRVSTLPTHIKTKYLLRNKDKTNPSVRIVPEIRKKLSFHRLNLIDDAYRTPEVFDVIFCRNVLIYFERQVQEEVINKMCNKLNKNGYLILGHSESTAGYNVPLKSMAASIYQKTE